MKNRAAIQRQAIAGSFDVSPPSPLSIAETQRHKKSRRQITRQITPRPQPESLQFLPFETYRYSARPIVVCHVIESLGLGGAQTMMMELVKALNKYFSQHTKNIFLAIDPKSYNEQFYSSYGIQVMQCQESGLAAWCVKENVDIVVHHRIALSYDLSAVIPSHIKYVFINHTWNSISSLKNYQHCDAYVSVCDFLSRHSNWRPKKKALFATILNGVENDYIAGIAPANLDGRFRTGRCHRLVSSKFSGDSLPWLSSMSTVIPGFYHYLIGNNDRAEKINLPNVTCFGNIYDRSRKMSILKDLHVYFYETFGPEGASIAVLESLACGVPVLCNPQGGNPELVLNGVNGYVVGSRSEFQQKMIELSDAETLNRLRAATVHDFDQRLHVRHTACKYVQLFERLIA